MVKYHVGYYAHLTTCSIKRLPPRAGNTGSVTSGVEATDNEQSYHDSPKNCKRILRRCRMTISKKLRFEVFKRDSFTCQYCGRSAPDVTLNADHIEPKSKGGADDILNLITSCFDCNQGKKDRQLSDDSVIHKRKRQLDELQERREQLEMLMEWQKELMNLNDETLQSMHELWKSFAKGYSISDVGLRQLQKWIKRYDLIELADAMRVSAEQYFEYPEISEGEPRATVESVTKAFDYIPRIIAGKKRIAEKPYLRDLYYARGILKRRLHYVNEWKALQLLEEAHLAGASTITLMEICKEVKNWTLFVSEMSALSGGGENNGQ